jgi:hypothetical protein
MDGAIAINPVSDCKARRIWTESSYAANASGAGNSRQHQEVLAFTAKNLGSVRGQVSRYHVDDDLPCPEHGVGDVFDHERGSPLLQNSSSHVALLIIEPFSLPRHSPARPVLIPV